MFVNMSSITNQIGNIVVKVCNGILPKMQIVSSGHEPSIYSRTPGIENADLSQFHVCLNFVYFMQT